MSNVANGAIKIAIIEDELAIADMYRHKLTQEGYSVDCAHDGESGLRLCKQMMPDLALIDIRMPLMSGDKMIERLRESEWGSKIRIIVLTNISRDEAPSILRFLNIDRYIVKLHTTPHQVKEIVNSVLI